MPNSFEETLVAILGELKKNNELLSILTSAAKAGLPADKGGTADAGTTTKTTRGKAADKAPKPPTAAAVTEETKKFLDVEAEEEYNDRRAFVVKVCEKFGVKKMSELAEGDRNPALDYLVAYKAGDETDLDEPKGRGRDDDVA